MKSVLFHKVAEDYKVAYHNSIRLSEGDQVKVIKRETNPEWLGLVFCEKQNGVQGWISETYLQISGSTATVLKSYDATELVSTSRSGLNSGRRSNAERLKF